MSGLGQQCPEATHIFIMHLTLPTFLSLFCALSFLVLQNLKKLISRETHCDKGEVDLLLFGTLCKSSYKQLLYLLNTLQS